MVKMERIDALIAKKGWSKRQLERESGLGVGSITKWNKNSPSVANLKKVAEVLGVSPAYLSGESDYQTEQDAQIAKWMENQPSDLADDVRKIEAGIRIPVLGSVPCGVPMEAIEMLDTEDWEEISEKMSRQGRFFGLKVKGDSMAPRIQAGDVLIVMQTEDAESGDIVIARINGNDATCKKIIKQENGIVLQPLNPTHEPMFFSNEEIVTKPVTIIGKVIENRQKF